VEAFDDSVVFAHEDGVDCCEAWLFAGTTVTFKYKKLGLGWVQRGVYSVRGGVDWADLMAAQGAFGTDFYDRSTRTIVLGRFISSWQSLIRDRWLRFRWHYA